MTDYEYTGPLYDRKQLVRRETVRLQQSVYAGELIAPLTLEVVAGSVDTNFAYYHGVFTRRMGGEEQSALNESLNNIMHRVNAQAALSNLAIVESDLWLQAA